MTFKTERLRPLLFAAAAAVWSAGAGACIADNSIGVDDGIKNGGADSPTRVQYLSLSYDPDGDQLIAGATNGVRVFDADDGNSLQSIPIDPMNPTFQAFRAGAVTAVSDANRIAIFDDTGNLLRTILPAGAPVLGGLFMMDLSPDGTLVASGDIFGHVRLFRTLTGAEIPMLAWPEAESVPFFSVRFSPDSAYLAAATISDTGTRIWRLEDGAVWADIPGFGAGIQFTPAGELARLGNDGVDVFAVPAGTKIATYPHGSGALAFSADGSLLAVYRPEGEPPGDGVIRVIDRATGAEAVRLFDDPRTRPADTGPKPRNVAALTFAGPDLVAVAWDDGRVAAFRLSDGSRLWSRLDSD